MWIEQKISINEKEYTCLVNGNEIEIPFFKGYENTLEVTIDGKTSPVLSLDNVGDRDETIKIEVKVNEHKSNKGRKTTKLSK
tara:strand:+ start:18360 stop:18605 length:246 start_codon:yes stop_codon:yes gene_type:complete